MEKINWKHCFKTNFWYAHFVYNNDCHTQHEYIKHPLSQYFGHELSFCLYSMKVEVSDYKKTTLLHVSSKV